MISPDFEFNTFLEAVKDSDSHTIIGMAEKEATEAWCRTYQKGYTLDSIHARSNLYQSKLLGLIDYLRHKIQSRSLTEKDYVCFSHFFNTSEKKISPSIQEAW